jgi:RNA-dependent RNA polymerase
MQFRLGGEKGVVVEDPTLDGKAFCLRPSQTKFDGLDNLTFDVQSTSSRPRPMFLNRPLIMLLEHLGVAPGVIIDLQSTSIREVQAIRTSLSQATKVFLQHNLGASYHLPSLFNNISEYLELDISDRPDDSLHHHLMEEAVNCAVTHALREIKYRAHILVPGSVTLFGVSMSMTKGKFLPRYTMRAKQRNSPSKARYLLLGALKFIRVMYNLSPLFVAQS